MEFNASPNTILPPGKRHCCATTNVLSQYEMLAYWKHIFTYLNHNVYERIALRRLCQLFKNSITPPPFGMYTVYPHPNHTSIDSLINRCTALHDLDPARAPSIVFIKEGDHQICGYYEKQDEDDCEDDCEDDDDDQVYQKTQMYQPYALIKYPLQIYGAGRNKTFVHGGGFLIKGKKHKQDGAENSRVELSDMHFLHAKGNGLKSIDGLSFACNNLNFTRCDGTGVAAWNTKGRLTNCVITQCGQSGIFSGGTNTLFELEGRQTKVDGNARNGSGDSFGLNTCWSLSSIHLLAPLTKESVSTNNGGGGNYGSYIDSGGTIQTVDMFEEDVVVVVAKQKKTTKKKKTTTKKKKKKKKKATAKKATARKAPAPAKKTRTTKKKAAGGEKGVVLRRSKRSRKAKMM